MNEEGSITMSEFKTVIEGFQSDIKKLAEATQFGFETMNAEFRYVKADIRELKEKVDRLDVKTDQLSTKSDSHAEQIALLHEDVTDIKNSLKLKVDREEFAKLEMRVTKLENKVA